MTPLSEVHAGLPGILIYSAALLLAVAHLAALIFAAQIEHSKRHILFSALHVLFGLAALILIMYSRAIQRRALCAALPRI